MNTFLLQIVIYWWLQRTSLEVAIWNCQEETALESSSSSLIALLSLSRSLSSYWTTNNVRSTFLNSCSYLLLLGRYLGVYTTSWILMANPTTIIIPLHKPAFLLSKMIVKIYTISIRIFLKWAPLVMQSPLGVVHFPSYFDKWPSLCQF